MKLTAPCFFEPETNLFHNICTRLLVCVVWICSEFIVSLTCVNFPSFTLKIMLKTTMAGLPQVNDISRYRAASECHYSGNRAIPTGNTSALLWSAFVTRNTVVLDIKGGHYNSSRRFNFDNMLTVSLRVCCFLHSFPACKKRRDEKGKNCLQNCDDNIPLTMEVMKVAVIKKKMAYPKNKHYKLWINTHTQCNLHLFTFQHLYCRSYLYKSDKRVQLHTATSLA